MRIWKCSLCEVEFEDYKKESVTVRVEARTGIWNKPYKTYLTLHLCGECLTKHLSLDIKNVRSFAKRMDKVVKK